ncbi:MAG TPA: thioredoxin domain-containing protein [Verrucomicrobiae bacterium]
MSHKHTNRLAKEKSPYLLQHQHNPVDWYPWGEEAFAKARKEDKPVLVSIGYSTCHWCHVMERESFESEAVARVLNEHFVCIKVDREERPDVDKIYMTAAQALTGSGGWPLNCFLTPELKPFYAGTYFPPEPKYGKPSFVELLQQIHQVWVTRRADVNEQAEDLTKQLAAYTMPSKDTNALLHASITQKALVSLKEDFEPTYGGFGGAPKFPRPSQPLFLLSAGSRQKDEEALKMVLFTCEKMAAGGMYDQLGGGFARYSVDAQWLVPHFEKMLYDNAQLVQLYLDAYLISREEKHAETVRDIIRYVLRDMTHAEGGFYSAEDADSEGQEGKFYCWTKKELETFLSADEAKVAIRYFGITEKGNFEDHSHPQPLKNLNVLSIVDAKLTAEEAKLLASAKEKMFATQKKRVRPHLDDKVLASWNGMMLGAMARAGVVLGEEKFLTAAEKNIAFLKGKLWDEKSKTLYHRWREGERDEVQLFDAYAFLFAGSLELYEATLKAEHLEFAIALADQMIARFYDQEDGGFFQSVATKDLIVNAKEDYDGAMPSANSVGALALLKLAAITDKKEYREKAEATLKLLSPRMQRMPHAVPYALLAMDFWTEEPRRVVIAGDAKSQDAKALLKAAHSVYQPHKVVLGNVGPVEEFAKTLPAKDGAVVYLCTGMTCQPPTKDAGKVREMLGK